MPVGRERGAKCDQIWPQQNRYTFYFLFLSCDFFDWVHMSDGVSFMHTFIYNVRFFLPVQCFEGFRRYDASTNLPYSPHSIVSQYLYHHYLFSQAPTTHGARTFVRTPPPMRPLSRRQQTGRGKRCAAQARSRYFVIIIMCVGICGFVLCTMCYVRCPGLLVSCMCGGFCFCVLEESRLSLFSIFIASTANIVSSEMFF